MTIAVIAPSSISDLPRHPTARASPATSPRFTPYYAFVVVILFVLLRVVRRTFANYRGARSSLLRTVAFGVFCVLLGAVFSALSFLGGVSYLHAVPQVLPTSAAILGSYRYTDRRISFWKTSGRTPFPRGDSDTPDLCSRAGCQVIH